MVHLIKRNRVINQSHFSKQKLILKSIMPNILAKTDPAANYQTLNSVATPITQQKLTAYGETEGAITTINGLIPIITDAITAGVITIIPKELHAQKTIFVKNRLMNLIIYEKQY